MEPLILAAIVLIVIVVLFVLARKRGEHYSSVGGHLTTVRRLQLLKQEAGGDQSEPLREHYGPPPGRQRALADDELNVPSWATDPSRAYEANTASSISHMERRSA